MATDFNQESVLRYIINNGGRVRNSELLTHYRRFLREDEEREQNRELFKKYVNSVATVRQEDGASHVVLRKKYLAHVGDIAKNRDIQKDPDPKPGVSTNQQYKQTALPIQPPQTRVEILPVAGIVTKYNNNNDSTPSLEKDLQTSAFKREPPVISVSCAEQIRDTCPAPPDIDSRSSGSGQSFVQPWESKAPREATGLEHNNIYPGKMRQLREADGCEQSFVNSTHCAYYEVRASPSPEKPKVNVNTPEAYNKHSQEPAAKAWPPQASLGLSHISTSTPCLVDVPQYIRAPLYTQAGLSKSNDSLLKPHVPQIAQNAPPTYLQLNRPTIPTTSHDSLSTTSISSLLSDTGWAPQGSGREKWPSDEGLRYQELPGQQDGNDVRAFLRRSQENRLLSQLHQPSRNIGPFHHSTGHLEDESRTSSRSASPETHYRPAGHSHLQSRMCRSLGENLDQSFPEEAGSTRQNRLQLLSSTLSMGNLVSSKGHSSRDLLSPAGSTRSLGHDGSFSSKHSSVPLDPREHEWFVKAASGTWTDIYALFRDDSSLLYKRDFISGFTILHWIAKHGDHRVLNTLYYGVEKAGMTFDVNSKTLCGYTPLHLAAIHGHKKLIRVLVQTYKADVRIRDSSGKRPWQYLSKDENKDILELLGAPQKVINCGTAVLDKHTMRPANTKPNVKRHTSIAALFKNKSHLRVASGPEAF
ncbi:ankyrin repeat domain-containing protein SOWAHB-like [Paramisgurnus dabryanus]|uniref:ankyrin repeat domain-containing protein SOWAHB-like n=1 Tax=Paramisgurnus dabryanus TaxID=90735 RepID=UPI0031F46E79